MHTSRNIGPDREETAPKWLTCIGVLTEASKQVCFVLSTGPASAPNEIGEVKEVLATAFTKRRQLQLAADATSMLTDRTKIAIR